MSDSVMAPQQRALDSHSSATPEPQWLTRRRAAAMRQFAELGLPKRTDEAWRFSDLKPLLQADGLPVPAADEPASPPALAGHRLPGTAHRIVLVNGRFSAELSQIGDLPRGAWLGSFGDVVDVRPDLAEAVFDMSEIVGAQGFASLNAALCAGGFILALDPGVALDHPVEVLHCGDAASPRAFHLRSAILMGAGSRASVVETYVGAGPGWTNAVATLDIGDGATLRHVKVQAEGDQATHLALARGRLGAEARYEGFVLIAGARLSRQDFHFSLDGESANFTLNGAYLLGGDQEATIAPWVDHRKPGGQTSELLKGVIGGHAHGVFLGSVTVREGADGTDARQLNRNLMLSGTARIDTKPELFIYADEVKCGHGATVGDLDEASLFYLVSRGIDPVTARNMLVEAFAADVFDVAALAPDIDAHARRYLEAWLERQGRAS